jgi:hypothetical protein
MNSKYSPAIFHLADTEFPGQIMPFGVVNRRNPRTLGNPEVINEYGVANSHLIKGIPAKWWHLHPGFRGINGESGIQHRGAPAMVSLKDRHQLEFLEGKSTSQPAFLMNGSNRANCTLHVLRALRSFWLISVIYPRKFIENVKFVRLWAYSCLRQYGGAVPRPMNWVVSLGVDCGNRSFSALNEDSMHPRYLRQI